MKLKMCGDDPKTTGHCELIAVADLLAIAVLNKDHLPRVVTFAQTYQHLRIEATRQAGINANA